MFAAYLDESYDPGNCGNYVVGGVVGDGWMMLKSTETWRALLAKHRLSKFKIANLRRRPKVIAEFAAVIRDSGFFAFGLIAEQAEVLNQLNGSALAKQYKESPYMLLYQLSFVRLAMKFRQLNSSEGLAFVCDENARYLPLMARSYPELRSINHQSAPYMGSCSMESDNECVPLQMADLIVGEIRNKAPSWTLDSRDFSESLHLLLADGTLGWVSRVDQQTLELIRQSVDIKHPPKRMGAAQSRSQG